METGNTMIQTQDIITKTEKWFLDKPAPLATVKMMMT
jgi:hypothetical protein